MDRRLPKPVLCSFLACPYTLSQESQVIWNIGAGQEKTKSSVIQSGEATLSQHAHRRQQPHLPPNAFPLQNSVNCNFSAGLPFTHLHHGRCSHEVARKPLQDQTVGRTHGKWLIWLFCYDSYPLNVWTALARCPLSLRGAWVRKVRHRGLHLFGLIPPVDVGGEFCMKERHKRGAGTSSSLVGRT